MRLPTCHMAQLPCSLPPLNVSAYVGFRSHMHHGMWLVPQPEKKLTTPCTAPPSDWVEVPEEASAAAYGRFFTYDYGYPHAFFCPPLGSHR